MKNKINKRLFGIAFLAVISTLISITFVYYGLFQKQVRNDLMISAKLLKDTQYFETRDIDIKKINLSADIKELRVTWVDSDGTVLYDNDVLSDQLSNHYDRPEIKSAFESGEGETIRKSDTMKKNTFYYAVKLDNGTVLRVATEAQSIWSIFLSAAPIIIFIIILIVAICMVISHILTKQLLRPIENMAENLDSADFKSPYKELDPLSQKLRSQHADILSAVKARQDFTANVSHELKTPLTAISGYVELLENDMVSLDKQKHFYTEIRKNCKRLLALINDIIRLSELDRSQHKLDFEEIDLYEIAVECVDELSISSRQKDINLILEGESVKMRGNKGMIKEMIENLGDNAIKYNNEGGTVIIQVKGNDGRPSIKVKDDGIGIPQQDIDRVFERFYRVDKSRSKATSGTGLGLAIVKHICEIHDGKIELESTLGKGSEITVTF